MATKKTLRNVDYQQKRTKKTKKRLHLIVIGLFVAGLLFIFFVMLFDYIFKPVADSDQLARKREKVAVSVFFSDENERFLVAEKRFVPRGKEPGEQAVEIVKALLDGSKTGLVNSFPPGVVLNGVKIADETAVVDLGKQLQELHPGGSASEMATIYSLTNSLITNLPEVKRVKILVDGAEILSIKGHIDTRRPFVFNKEFVAPQAKGEANKR